MNDLIIDDNFALDFFRIGQPLQRTLPVRRSMRRSKASCKRHHPLAPLSRRQARGLREFLQEHDNYLKALCPEPADYGYAEA